MKLNFSLSQLRSKFYHTIVVPFFMRPLHSLQPIPPRVCLGAFHSAFSAIFVVWRRSPPKSEKVKRVAARDILPLPLFQLVFGMFASWSITLFALAVVSLPLLLATTKDKGSEWAVGRWRWLGQLSFCICQTCQSERQAGKAETPGNISRMPTKDDKCKGGRMEEQLRLVTLGHWINNLRELVECYMRMKLAFDRRDPLKYIFFNVWIYIKIWTILTIFTEIWKKSRFRFLEKVRNFKSNLMLKSWAFSDFLSQFYFRERQHTFYNIWHLEVSQLNCTSILSVVQGLTRTLSVLAAFVLGKTPKVL